MKRIYLLIAFLLLITVIVGLTACKVTTSKQTTASESVFDELNDLTGKEYDSITLTTLITEDSKTLRGSYTANKQGDTIKVEYSYQKFALFEEVNGELIAPENEIEIVAGSLTLKDGVVTDSSGAEIDFSTKIVSARLSFNEDWFDNVMTGEGRFVASVKSPRSFLGIDNATDMSVEVTYDTSRLKTILVKYKLEKTNIELAYSF